MVYEMVNRTAGGHSSVPPEHTGSESRRIARVP
jgi:hypothetical protein